MGSELTLRIFAVLMGLAAAGLIGVALVTYRDFRTEPAWWTDGSQEAGA